MEKAIELQGLTKYYGKQRGIEDLSFSVEAGEVFGFIGPNGAGKSTTIRTLLALFKPTGGSGRIFGKDCVKEAPAIAREVGYLPSEAAYYDNMRAGELLDYTAALYQKNCKAKTQELCQRLGLDTKRRIADLSFGNRKKVGIVSALLHSPRLIILDEPTAGLDPLVQQTFFEILAQENQRGATIFFSSHILSEVQRFCQKAAILREGRLVAVQDIAQLRQNGYKKISVTTPQAVNAHQFAGGEITQLHRTGEVTSFLYKGVVPALLEQLAALTPADVFVEEPTLEEIFLHYYQ